MNTRQQKYFYKIINIIEGKGYELVSKTYSGCETPVVVRCKFGNKYKVTPRAIYSGKFLCRCEDCDILPDNMSVQQKIYYDRIIDVANENGGKVLSNRYYKNNIKMKFLCKSGHVFEREPRYVACNKKWCPVCPKSDSDLTNEEKFNKVLVNKCGKLLSSYIRYDVNVEVMCSNGHRWATKPSTIIDGCWCPGCAYNKDTTFKEHLRLKGYELLSEYNGAKEKVTLRCPLGHLWKTRPDSVFVNECYECSVSNRKHSTDFICKVSNKGGEILSDYITMNDDIVLRCDKGHTWTTTPSCICQDTWCPICCERISSGERMVIRYLEKNNITYKKEFSIDIIPKRRFDFYCSVDDNNFIIEYDGRQHFQEVSVFHSEKYTLEDSQRLDIVKTCLAIHRGFNVIRIDHTEIDNIAQHLNKAFELKSKLYVSTPNMYNWLSGRSITQDDIDYANT